MSSSLVLNEAGVQRGSDGKKRVPYSLRRAYATMRISEGVSVFQLAANMGTSVEMIESFYGKKRMRDPKMATEVTKFSGRLSHDKVYYTIEVSDRAWSKTTFHFWSRRSVGSPVARCFTSSSSDDRGGGCIA